MTNIRVIDFETTGTDSTSEVCEWAYVDVCSEKKSISEGSSSLCGVSSMPYAAQAVHHISIHECEDKEPFNSAALASDNNLYCAHNADFEKQFFNPEGSYFICTYKCALRMWPDLNSHTNFSVFYWLVNENDVPFNPSRIETSHRALPDAYATAVILNELLKNASVKDLIKWSMEPKIHPTCPIGKFRGKKWSEVESGFLNWMINQNSMEEDLKYNAKIELKRRGNNG